MGQKTIQRVSVRIILVVAQIKGSRIWVVVVKVIYLQSDKTLIRKMFITSCTPELKLSSAEFLNLLRPIYSLADSEDELCRTLDDHL